MFRLFGVPQSERRSSAGENEHAESARLPGFATQTRRLRNNLIALALFFVIVVGLLFAVPGLRSAGERITDTNIGWLAIAVALELLSCVSYVILFGLVFKRLGRSLSSRLSLAELAMNSVVSVSGLGGIALGAWVLHSKGISMERIARRSVLLFVLTSAVNVVAVVVFGIPMWLGLLPGTRNELLTLLPAAIALIVIIGTLVLARSATRAATQTGQHGRVRTVLLAAATGVTDAVELIRHHDWRLLGAVGYWLWDNLCLFVCLAAYGNPPTFWAVAMAYLVGMLGNSLPLPGGFFLVEGGLVGMLVLLGTHPVSLALAAVLVYRAISLWIPALIGALAFLSLRSEIGKPLGDTAHTLAGG
ncbi:MAG TPA: lysylphosphatidylglycerol synthase transmembrane domain-containing protein [Solirubrobacteraceae bacterium]